MKLVTSALVVVSLVAGPAPTADLHSITRPTQPGYMICDYLPLLPFCPR